MKKDTKTCELQNRMVDRYLEIHNWPSYKYISKDTGIQITRVFRIFNGREMKLSELEKFQNSIFRILISKNQESTIDQEKLGPLMRDCILTLSPKSIAEIITVMERKIQLRSLLDKKTK